MRISIAGLILAGLFVAGCDVCGEDKLSETNSPANNYVATVFRRSCGATTGFLYHVNLRKSASSFASDYRGVIEDDQVFLTREGKISITWKDEKNLQITCDGCQKDRKPTMQGSWNDVTISYDLH